MLLTPHLVLHICLYSYLGYESYTLLTLSYRYLGYPIYDTAGCADINGVFSAAGVNASMCDATVPEANNRITYGWVVARAASCCGDFTKVNDVCNTT